MTTFKLHDEQLSKNFTLREMCNSITAKNHGIDNTPDAASIDRLRTLCKDVLQQARDSWGKPIHVNSGYRSAALNKAVGGKKNSYHLTGQAADLHVENEGEGFTLSALLLRSKLTDLVLLEKRGRKFWIHVQWSMAPRHKFSQDYAD